MRKWVIVVSIFIAVIFLFLLSVPFSMGFWLQHHYPSLLQRVSYPELATFKLIRFDRGWFVAHATVQITPRNQNQFPSLLVQQRIQSGPLVFSKTASGAWHWSWAKALIDSQSLDSTFRWTARTQLRMDNTLDTTVKATQLTFAQTEQRRILQNLRLRLIFVPSSKTLTLKGKAATLKTYRDVPILYAQHIAFNAKLHKTAPWVWVGDRRLHVRRITLFPQDEKKQWQLDRVRFNTHQTAAQTTTTLTITAGVRSIRAPDVTIQPLAITFSLSDLNTAALSQFLRAVIQTHPASTTVKAWATLLPHLWNLISHGFSASLTQLTLNTTTGLLSAEGRLSFFPPMSAFHLPSLLQATTLTFHAKVPSMWLAKSLVYAYQNNLLTVADKTLPPNETANQQIQRWIESKKIIVASPDIVTFQLLFQQNHLFINGLPQSYTTPGFTTDGS